MKRPAPNIAGVYDAAALGLLVFACVAFVLGGSALSRADDFMGIYWFLVGVATMLGAVKVSQTGGGRA